MNGLFQSSTVVIGSNKTPESEYEMSRDAFEYMMKTSKKDGLFPHSYPLEVSMESVGNVYFCLIFIIRYNDERVENAFLRCAWRGESNKQAAIKFRDQLTRAMHEYNGRHPSQVRDEFRCSLDYTQIYMTYKEDFVKRIQKENPI